jgi:hypothetical protein
MNGMQKRTLAHVWTFAGVPLTFALFVAGGYAIWGTPMPFKGGLEFLLLATLIVLSLSGALAIAVTFNRLWWLRVTAAVVYFTSMLVVLSFVALLVGCFNGDCL